MKHWHIHVYMLSGLIDLMKTFYWVIGMTSLVYSNSWDHNIEKNSLKPWKSDTRGWMVSNMFSCRVSSDSVWSARETVVAASNSGPPESVQIFSFTVSPKEYGSSQDGATQQSTGSSKFFDTNCDSFTHFMKSCLFAASPTPSNKEQTSIHELTCLISSFSSSIWFNNWVPTIRKNLSLNLT